MERRKTDFVSKDIGSIENESLGFEKALLVRDADGHAVRIIDEDTKQK